MVKESHVGCPPFFCVDEGQRVVLRRVDDTCVFPVAASAKHVYFSFTFGGHVRSFRLGKWVTFVAFLFTAFLISMFLGFITDISPCAVLYLSPEALTIFLNDLTASRTI